MNVPVDVPGGTLATTALGSGSTVVLIHGTAPAIWGELPSLLAADHRVVQYDRRTFGTASGLREGDLRAHAEDAAAVIRAHGGRAIVVGWSIGGVIALDVAAAHPELVEALVLLEPPLHAKRRPSPRMVGAIAGATVLGKLGRPHAGARRFLGWALGRRDGSSDLGALPSEWHARLDAGDDAAVVAELARGTGEHLTTSALATIAVPVSVLRGDSSQPAFAAAADRVVAAVPQATLVDVTGCGHAVHLDAADQVVESVRNHGRPARAATRQSGAAT